VTTGALVLALTLSQSGWSATPSQHFEVHYPAALAGERDRIIQAAEEAYRHVSGRLDFVLPTRIPLVVFAPSGPLSRDEVVAYAASDAVAPQAPHRSRIVVPLSDRDQPLEALLVHEITHLLAYEIILPGRGGDGGLPRWIREGVASYMVGPLPDEDARLMRELVASGSVPALSGLTDSGGFADPRLNDIIGHVAFDYLESRWGASAVRRFIDALIVPRVNKTFDAVLDLTPAEFDAAFRRYAEVRFGRPGR